MTTQIDLEKTSSKQWPAKYWKACQDNYCRQHLEEKWNRQWFPGTEAMELYQTLHKQRTMKHRCDQDQWELCFVPWCQKHHNERQAMGLDGSKKLAQLPEFEVNEAGTNTPQMINAMALNATACVTHLKIRIQLAGVTALAMIDSGATRNFMSRKFATNHRIPGLPKERPYQLTVVDETPLNQDEGMVKEETLPLMSQIHGKDLGRITFDLVSIPHEVILGIPWLEKVNPSIDWNSQKITIGKEKLKKSTLKQGKTPMIEICKISQKQIRKIQQQEPQKVLNVWIKPVSGQLNATQEEDET